MKKLFKGISLVTILFIVHSCGSLKNKDITGEKEIKQVFKTKQFKDSNDVFYAIVVGEHGDEMEAKNLALAEARLQFTTKGTSMVESAVKKAGTRSMNDRIGSLDVITKNVVISKHTLKFNCSHQYLKVKQNKNLQLYSHLTLPLD